jgi:hypothetical protein
VGEDEDFLSGVVVGFAGPVRNSCDADTRERLAGAIRECRVTIEQNLSVRPVWRRCQHRVELLKKMVQAFLIHSRGLCKHLKPGLGDSSTEVVEQKQKIIGDITKNHPRWIKSNVQGLRVRPHHGEERVDGNRGGGHALIVPSPTLAGLFLCTGYAGGCSSSRRSRSA